LEMHRASHLVKPRLDFSSRAREHEGLLEAWGSAGFSNSRGRCWGRDGCW
jgi:hypothetical protein